MKFRIALITSLIGILSTSVLYPETALMFPQKGMCYVTWDKNRFASQYSDESIKKLRSMGVDHISVCVTQYQERFDSTEIKRTDRTPSDKSLSHLIKFSHKSGLNVMLKPHIDLMDKLDGTYWRADIGFQSEKNWKEWFKNYKKFIIHYARIAEKYKVEIFCVGTELSFTTEKNTEWRTLISEIKKVYNGKITYAANWDNFKNIKFWNDLDYVGIDAYFPLTYKPDPSAEDLKQGWKKWRQDIASWQKVINKPVIFTEIGYPSALHAPNAPWKSATRGNPAPELQADCYKAFFETVWNEPWFAGAYWWKWDTNVRAGGENNRQFTPQNKPAQKVIELNYKHMKNRGILNEVLGKKAVLDKSRQKTQGTYPLRTGDNIILSTERSTTGEAVRQE